MSQLDFSKQMLKTVVAQVCLAVGWTDIYPSSLELMVDLLHNFLRNLTFRSAEIVHHVSGGLTRQPTPEIVWSVLEGGGFNFLDMKDFLDAFHSVSELKPRIVPQYPVPAIRAGENDDEASGAILINGLDYVLSNEDSSDCEELSMPPPPVPQTQLSIRVQQLRQSPQWKKWSKRAKKFRHFAAIARTFDNSDLKAFESH